MLIDLIIAILVIGLVFYLLQLLPIDARFKQAIQVIILVVVIIWLLTYAFGGGSIFVR